MKTASWIIRRRDTGEVICEIFADHIQNLKPEFEAIPILEYLQSLNNRGAGDNSARQE